MLETSCAYSFACDDYAFNYIREIEFQKKTHFGVVVYYKVTTFYSNMLLKYLLHRSLLLKTLLMCVNFM